MDKYTCASNCQAQSSSSPAGLSYPYSQSITTTTTNSQPATQNCFNYLEILNSSMTIIPARMAVQVKLNKANLSQPFLTSLNIREPHQTSPSKLNLSIPHRIFPNLTIPLSIILILFQPISTLPYPI